MKCYGYKQCVHFLHGLLRRWWDPISLIKKLLAVLIGWDKNSLGMTRAATSIFLTETGKNCIKCIDSRRWKSAVTAADCCSFHIDDGKYFHIENKIVSSVSNSLYGHNFVKLWALYGCFFCKNRGVKGYSLKQFSQNACIMPVFIRARWVHCVRFKAIWFSSRSDIFTFKSFFQSNASKSRWWGQIKMMIPCEWVLLSLRLGPGCIGCAASDLRWGVRCRIFTRQIYPGEHHRPLLPVGKVTFHQPTAWKLLLACPTSRSDRRPGLDQLVLTAICHLTLVACRATW